MKKILIQLFVWVALSNAAYSQKYNGYVITESDSLIKGYMNLQNTYENGIKIMLYPDKNKREKPQIFYSLEVKEYAYKKDTFRILTNLHLVTSFSGGDVPFRTEAKVIVRGRLYLYQVNVIKGNTFISNIPMGGIGGNNLPGYSKQNIIKTYFIEDFDGFTFEVNKKNFKSTMKDVLKGAPVLLAKIENKELKFKDLKSIVREYNSMIITRPKKRESSTF